MADDIILKVENISKQYRLGQVGTGTLSHDLNRWWHTIRGKEDPYLKVGDLNNRATKAESDYVWALKDITFDVKRGEVLGIIGKNGAGKSTLLKILSKVTSPTTGSIKSKGRIASLLEVGTGFNPELTGRENIFLNGAILGMTKKEIASKIDEIIEFSGCERYIDTPTKRYSSGMTVRLAFAVAAFLEPEILVVDEVLAVGDAEFQKKAIGKMQDISREGGRTVLFVSHNMAAVKSLCTNGIVLQYGKIAFQGPIEESLEFYSSLSVEDSKKGVQHIDHSKSLTINNYSVQIGNKELINGQSLYIGDQISINLNLTTLENITDFSIAMDVNNVNQELVSHITNEDDGMFFKFLKKGATVNISIKTAQLLFVPGFYAINIWFGVGQIDTLYKINNFFHFYLEQGTFSKRTKAIPSHSKIFLPTTWKINE